MAKYSGGLEDKLDIPESSVKVLESRYLTKDQYGKVIETGESMFKRVAKDVASAELFYLDIYKEKVNTKTPTDELYKIAETSEEVKKREEEFFNIMKNFYFIPNSPTLMNAGKKLQQLSACFVLPIGDSMESIFETQKDMAVVHKSGGGTGFSFSRLRPNGTYVNSTNGYSPGPVSFLFTYNESAGQITQGGKRRGANMGIINACHPDSLDWARVKSEEGVLSNFNLSIAFSDEDMNAVKEDSYILLKDSRKDKEFLLENAKRRAKEIRFGKGDIFKTSWKISNDEKLVIDTYTEETIGKVGEDGKIYLKAKKLFGTIVEGTWKKGEPGIIFLDKMNNYNPTPEVGKIESTNPCGEQPLLPYESCNLGAINLSKMVNKNKEIDYSLLEKTVRSATRFMDNVIDRNNYPLKEIEEITKSNRKIGLGVMGFAHLLIKRGISYNSEEAIKEAEKIMNFINETSKDESRNLAKERGEFPNFNKSIYQSGEAIRNATTTTIAPTGTTGVIAAASQGIEPVYQLVAKRNVKETIGQDLIEVDREFRNFLIETNICDEKTLAEKSAEKIIEDITDKEIKEKAKKLFVTAHEIPAEQHLKIQAAFQKYVDNAVSKTINMPKNSTKEDVWNAYMMAYDLGCKGVTIYRDGSRDFQLLTSANKKNLEEKISDKKLKNNDRPNVLGTTIKQKTPHGNAFITLNVLEEEHSKPYEFFVTIGKGGRDIAAIAEGYGRLISLAFKNNISVEEIIEQLSNISGETQTGLGENKIYSVPDAIAKGLVEAKTRLNNGKSLDIETKKHTGDLCPECSSPLIHGEGCKGGSCSNCGYSKC